jgi:hypothetical protein
MLFLWSMTIALPSQYIIITTSNTPVLATPKNESTRVTILPKGTILNYRGKSGSFFRVTLFTKTVRYIPMSQAKFSKTKIEVTPQVLAKKVYERMVYFEEETSSVAIKKYPLSESMQKKYETLLLDQFLARLFERFHLQPVSYHDIKTRGNTHNW